MKDLRRLSAVAVLALASVGLASCANAPPAPAGAIQGTLAPTGKLRVAVYAGSPTSLVRSPVTGETKGVAIDLGQAMAARLGVPFELAEFPNNAAALAAVKDGRADFAFTNATPERAKDMDFSPPVLATEQGYLVPKGSPIAAAAGVDRAGVSVGVSQGSSSERVLKREFRHAMIVPVPTLKTGTQLLLEGKLDAYATNKAILHEMSDGVPGSRVLEGGYGQESFAIGIPKGREAGWDWLRGFVAEARAQGTVKRAVERAGLRGVTEPAAT